MRVEENNNLKTCVDENCDNSIDETLKGTQWYGLCKTCYDDWHGGYLESVYMDD